MGFDLPKTATSIPDLHQKETDFFSLLDLTNTPSVIDFEKAFYKAFVNLHSNQLVRKIWDWDKENERLKTKISYENQVIFTWKNPKGEIKCATAVNINNNLSQFANFGFKVPDNKQGKYCEVLTLFTQNIERTNGIRLDRFFLRGFCIAHLQHQGYNYILSTCAQRPLNTYLRWGWEIVDEATIENEKRYFLYYDIKTNLNNL
ncbi:MAG TPA: hypothetical protein VIK89_07990 [Cytophagaceae bacterium]